MSGLKKGIFVFVISFAFLFVFCGTVKADSAEIKNVNVSLDYPMLGTKFKKVDDGNGGYNQDPQIDVTTDNPNVIALAEIRDSNLDTYEGFIWPGEQYVFGIAVGTLYGYYLSEDSLNVTINGLKVTDFIYRDDTSVVFLLYYTYPGLNLDTKKTNPMTVSYKNKKIKYKKLKKKKKTVSLIKVSKAQGTVKYSKIGGSKRISINKNTGKITIKKKTKRGVYKIKVKVTASGNSNYKSSSSIGLVIIKVK